MASVSLLNCTVTGNIEAKSWRDSGLGTFCSTRNQKFHWSGATWPHCQGTSLKRDRASNTSMKGSNNCCSIKWQNYDRESNCWHNDDTIWLFHAIFLFLCMRYEMSVDKCWHATVQFKSMNDYMRNRKLERISIILWILFDKSECKTKFNYYLVRDKIIIKLLACLWTAQPISHFFISYIEVWMYLWICFALLYQVFFQTRADSIVLGIQPKPHFS